MKQSSINRVSGYVIFSRCISFLRRLNNKIKRSIKHYFFFKKIHSTAIRDSILLLYTEGILFLSVFPFPNPDGLPSLGCMPAPYLSISIT